MDYYSSVGLASGVVRWDDKSNDSLIEIYNLVHTDRYTMDGPYDFKELEEAILNHLDIDFERGFPECIDKFYYFQVGIISTDTSPTYTDDGDLVVTPTHEIIEINSWNSINLLLDMFLKSRESEPNSTEWQKGEREAEDDIKNQRVHTFNNADDAIAFFRSDED
ncbi:AbrB family transcriptional regulator-like protein [Bacillus phage Shbh1]|uniref:AbrB family transcriptional regulator-like protein n=1 Tax=Bacillus phage Shbh1 TaxID=1796992 RepID=A0A142F1A6_9CAUD|nr:AbrB family transcriptional regulator-like protein [Bacillus phage Shbh1]AMQ66563.1 AbrB family transcriptional regulator-like protein [Bacillus phage Shbh1]